MKPTYTLTDTDIDGLNVLQLKSHLKSINAKVYGNKSELSERLKNLVKRERNHPGLSAQNIVSNIDSLEEKRKIFDSRNLKWTNDIAKLKNVLPDEFGIEKINEHLTTPPVFMDEEEVNFTTEKPFKKACETSRENNTKSSCSAATTLLGRHASHHSCFSKRVS